MVRIIIVSILSAFIFISCGNSDNNRTVDKDNDHVLLFNQSAALIKNFTTKISMAPDSL